MIDKEPNLNYIKYCNEKGTEKHENGLKGNQETNR
jgi:hypothetical protein